MIFVTVGAQMPFDRLIAEVDAWAGERGRGDVFAQIGPSEFQARHIRTTHFLEPADFRRHGETARAIVSHAGMGTIITALEIGKPLLVFPRLLARAETRSDHQVATARRFSESRRVLAAFDADQLRALLDEVESFVPLARIGDRASPELLDRVRRFALGDSGRCRAPSPGIGRKDVRA